VTGQPDYVGRSGHPPWDLDGSYPYPPQRFIPFASDDTIAVGIPPVPVVIANPTHADHRAAERQRKAAQGYHRPHKAQHHKPVSPFWSRLGWLVSMKWLGQ
jgi:hypothetical protein